MKRNKLLMLSVAFFAGALLVAASLAGCGGEEPKGICYDCLLPSDCESGVCACVNNWQTQAQYCWACAPVSYDPLKGALQDRTFDCTMVKP
jgi:hypothetical protein